MCCGGSKAYVRRVNRGQKEAEMKHTIAITAAAVAVIVAIAFSTLAVFSARAGQQHGLDCAKVSNPCGK